MFSKARRTHLHFVLCSVLVFGFALPGGAQVAVLGDCNCSGSLEASDPICVVLRLVGAYNPETCLSICGNAVVEAGEDCDQGNLNGATCISEGFSGTGLVCGAGCVFDTSACSPATTTTTTTNTTTTTVPPCSGDEVGGFCWFLGDINQSCDARCANAGLNYDEAGTRDFAGSGGGTANCDLVMTALGVTDGPAFSGPCSSGAGCAWAADEGGVQRCSSPPTTGSATTIGGVVGQTRRACACKP